jgi:hypothetical protein
MSTGLAIPTYELRSHERRPEWDLYTKVTKHFGEPPASQCLFRITKQVLVFSINISSGHIKLPSGGGSAPSKCCMITRSVVWGRVFTFDIGSAASIRNYFLNAAIVILVCGRLRVGSLNS